MVASLESRIGKLESRNAPARGLIGAIRVIRHGPEDDPLVEAARLEAEASGKWLIVRDIITPSRSHPYDGGAQ